MDLPYKIMLEKHINELLKNFIDNPNALLPKIRLSSQLDKQAYELISLLMDDNKKEEFNNSKKPLNEMVQNVAKAKRMNHFNDAFSLEPINWRSAQVLSEKISLEEISLLFFAVKDKKFRIT